MFVFVIIRQTQHCETTDTRLEHRVVLVAYSLEQQNQRSLNEPLTSQTFAQSLILHSGNSKYTGRDNCIMNL